MKKKIKIALDIVIICIFGTTILFIMLSKLSNHCTPDIADYVGYGVTLNFSNEEKCFISDGVEDGIIIKALQMDDSKDFWNSNNKKNKIIKQEEFEIWLDKGLQGFSLSFDATVNCSSIWDELKRVSVKINNKKYLSRTRRIFRYQGKDQEEYLIELAAKKEFKVNRKITVYWLDHDEFEKHKIEYLHNNLSKLLPIFNQTIKNNTSLDLENIKLECNYNINQESKTITTILPFQLLGKKEKSFSCSDLGLEDNSKNTTNLKCEVIGVEIVEEDVIFLNKNDNYTGSYQEYLKFGEHKLNQNGVFRIRTVWNGSEIQLIIN